MQRLPMRSPPRLPRYAETDALTKPAGLCQHADHQDTFDIRERAIGDPYSLSGSQIGIRSAGKSESTQRANGLDLGVLDMVRPSIPTAHADQSSGLETQVAGSGQMIAQEEVTGKQRLANPMFDTGPS